LFQGEEGTTSWKQSFKVLLLSPSKAEVGRAKLKAVGSNPVDSFETVSLCINDKKVFFWF
jgi:hypothetical protein